MVSVTISHFCGSMKGAASNRQMHEHVCTPIELYLQNQVVKKEREREEVTSRNRPVGLHVLTSAVKDEKIITHFIFSFLFIFQ